MLGWLSTQLKRDAELTSAVPFFSDAVKTWLVFAACMFSVLAVMHLLLLPEAVRWPMFWLASVSAAFLMMFRVALWSGYLSYRYVVHALFVIGVVTWVNCTAHLWLSGEPMQATNLAIVIMAAGVVLLRWLEYAAIASACIISWVATLVSSATLLADPAWLHFSIFLLESLLFASIAFYWRRHTLQRNLQLNRERRTARENEHLSLLAAQSKAIEAERNLRRALEADASKSMFLANMSHELRTPLNSVVGFAQLLRDRPEIAARPDLVHDYADCIQTSGSHLLGLINQILDLSRANAGGIRLNESRVDIAEMILEITRLLSPQAAEAKVGLHAHAGSGQYVIRADDLRIRQIITNLVANALKFTPAGGRVDVSVGYDGSGLTLEVRDTGVGIAMQDMARVFEPFVQADGGFSKAHQGTGLGLAITRKLVELHGGTIGVKSVLGEGSVFLVRFPVSRVETIPHRVTA
jgi:signal transduction histidine kinase